MDYSTLNKSSNSNPRLRLIYATGTILVAAFFGWVLFFRPPATKYAAIGTKAVAVLSGDSKVTGVVTFTQTDEGVTVSGTIRNLDPNSKRGFHVHQLGDLSNGCTSATSHFNPLGKTHGAPADATRHAGDLGNIQSNNEGIAEFSFIDTVISLSGEKGIVGRSVVVHAGTDDLGKGGNEESLKTGNAGGRAACGVIGLAELS